MSTKLLTYYVLGMVPSAKYTEMSKVPSTLALEGVMF